MKVFIFCLFSLFSLTSFSFECTKTEAQFIGKVFDYKQTDCSYIIQFRLFNSSSVCPLDISEVYTTRFTDESCTLKNGEEVSGYLAKDLSTLKIKIEE